MLQAPHPERGMLSLWLHPPRSWCCSSTAAGNRTSTRR